MPLLGAAQSSANEPAWQRFGVAFAAVAGVIVIGRYLTRPAMRLVAKSGLREIFTAFALLLVVGIAHIMTLAGLSMALVAATLALPSRPTSSSP